MNTCPQQSFISQLLGAIFGKTFSPGPGSKVLVAPQEELDRRDYDNLILAKERNCLLEEIAELKKANSELERMATLDHLTKLFNRHGGELEFNRALAPYRRREHDRTVKFLRPTHVAVVVIDLDNFKQINDNLGHATGDQVLVAVAGHIRKEFRTDDIVIRWGGDEIVIYAIGATQEAVFNRAQELTRVIGNDQELRVGNLRVTCSIGLAHGKFRTERGARGLIDSLRKSADEAMYLAKESLGKGCIATASDNFTAE